MFPSCHHMHPGVSPASGALGRCSVPQSYPPRTEEGRIYTRLSLCWPTQAPGCQLRTARSASLCQNKATGLCPSSSPGHKLGGLLRHTSENCHIIPGDCHQAAGVKKMKRHDRRAVTTRKACSTSRAPSGSEHTLCTGEPAHTHAFLGRRV